MYATQPIRSLGRHRRPGKPARLLLGCLMPLALLAAAPGASAGAALERIKASGKLTLGYDLDRPFSYKDASGNPMGGEGSGRNSEITTAYLVCPAAFRKLHRNKTRQQRNGWHMGAFC